MAEMSLFVGNSLFVPMLSILTVLFLASDASAFLVDIDTGKSSFTYIVSEDAGPHQDMTTECRALGGRVTIIGDNEEYKLLVAAIDTEMTLWTNINKVPENDTVHFYWKREEVDPLLWANGWKNTCSEDTFCVVATPPNNQTDDKHKLTNICCNTSAHFLCEDVDECACTTAENCPVDKWGCSDSEQCFNSIGNYSCVERPAPPTLSSKPTRVPAGERAQLYCDTSYTNTINDYIFYRNGTVRFHSSLPQITINSFGSNHEGSYTCSFVSDEVESIWSKDVYISVIPPTQPDFRSSSTEVRDGQSVTLTCEAYNLGSKKFVWKKNGTTLIDTTLQTLTIGNFSSENVGSYACAIDIASTSSPDSRPILIKLKPNTPVLSSNITLLPRGEAVSFTCLGSNTEPMTYTYMRDHGYIVATNQDATYVLTDFDIMLQGRYSCIVEIDNVTSDPSNDVNLTLALSAPILTVFTTEVYPGSSVRLTCDSVDDGDKVFTWIKDGMELINSNNSSIAYEVSNRSTADGNSSTLSMWNFELEASGDYECHVTINNEDAPASNTVSLTLVPIEAPILSASNEEITEGDVVDLICNSSTPVPKNYSWSKDGQPFQSPQISSDLNLIVLNSSSEGQYRCRVLINQESSPWSNNVNLTYTGFLKVTLRSTLTVVPEGLSIKLTCSSSRAGLHSYQWLKDGKTFLTTTNSETYLRDFATKDQGNYSCQVKEDISTLAESNPLELTAVPRNYLCGCPCSSFNHTFPLPTKNASFAWLKRLTSAIHKHLIVNTANLSATERRRISAPDERVSSTSIGLVAVSVLASTFFIIIFSDAIYVITVGTTVLKSWFGCSNARHCP